MVIENAYWTMSILSFIGDLEYRHEKSEIQIPLSQVKDGVNQFADHFIYKESGDIRIYDRICDHSGGKLTLNSNSNYAKCPNHGWKFFLKTGVYHNDLKKHVTPYSIKNNTVFFQKTDLIPYLESRLIKKNSE